MLIIPRYAVSKTAHAVRSRLPQGQSGSAAISEPIAIPIRNASRHPLHPFAVLKQSRTGQVRGFATSIRSAFVETYPSLRRIARQAPSRTATLAKAPSAATFGSALRPRLTGGAIPRTAGGYVGVGGRRAFSHVSSSQQQVLANVSAGVRAFWLSGQRAQFDGINKKTGEHRFIAVGKEAEKTTRMIKDSRFNGDARGTSLEFCVAPELYSFRGNTKKAGRAGSNNLPAAIAPLATDFARSLGALAAVHKDLKKLSQLGELPISEPRPGWIAVRFAGCDGESVERLCDELGILRGIVREDEAWSEEKAQDVKMALLFPTAPSATMSEDGDAAACFYHSESVHDNNFDFVMPESLEDHCSNDAFTTEETLSPLESLHGSPVSGFDDPDHLSHSSLFSWQPNPWLSEAREPDGGSEQNFSHKSRSSIQGISSASRELENIYMFIAECNGRLGPAQEAR